MELRGMVRMPVRLQENSEVEVRNADEIWVSSATKEVIAVMRLDGRAVGNGKPGAVFKRMHRPYQDYKRTVMPRG